MDDLWTWDGEGKLLNYGCGYDRIPGATNVDFEYNDDPHWVRVDYYDYILLSHVLEHIADPLHTMEHIHEMVKPDGLVIIRTPYGNSLDAWENPYHRRPYFYKSFAPFAQWYWWREDAENPYIGDFEVETIWLKIYKTDAEKLGMIDDKGLLLPKRAMDVIRFSNDVVAEMETHLRPVKPIRRFEKGTKPEEAKTAIPICMYFMVTE